jgi:hypothetical protein
MPSTYYVAWWNLENLFDEENAPASRRTDKVFRAIKDDIAGWTPQSRDRKVDQLASVIAQMNAGGGPDLLGVCEVENRFARVTLRRGERRRDEGGTVSVLRGGCRVGLQGTQGRRRQNRWSAPSDQGGVLQPSVSRRGREPGPAARVVREATEGK